jgi:hypothetical protein
MSFESRPVAGQPRREGRRRRAAVFSRRPPPWVHPLTAHAPTRTHARTQAHTHTHAHTHSHTFTTRVCARTRAHAHACARPTHPPAHAHARARTHTRAQEGCGRSGTCASHLRAAACLCVCAFANSAVGCMVFFTERNLLLIGGAAQVRAPALCRLRQRTPPRCATSCAALQHGVLCCNMLFVWHWPGAVNGRRCTRCSGTVLHPAACHLHAVRVRSPAALRAAARARQAACDVRS